MDLGRRLGAEFVGTFVLVFAGVGSAVLAAAFPRVGIGLLGVALAFGIALMVMAYTIGRISGCHVNPAVTVGFAVAGKFPWGDVIPYIVAQVAGAIAGAAVLYGIATGSPGFNLAAGFGSNGYGVHSPGGYTFVACLLAEIVLTFIFVLVVLGSSLPHLPTGFAPLAAGFALTLVHLVGIPVTNLSVNPARSTGPAMFAGGWALAQLWFFWVFPMVGAALAGLVHMVLQEERAEQAAATGPTPIPQPGT